MRKAAVVPFFNYGQGNELLLWKFFFLHAAKWAEFVDKIYVIDSGVGIDSMIGNITVIKKPAQSHWKNMNEVVKEIPEPLLLLLDSDTIIYDPTVVKTYFDAIETLDDDVWTIFDSSGGVKLADRFPIMAENHNRGERRRFCPYLCFLRKSILRKDFDFTPIGGENWMDSMGKITEQILEDGHNVCELQDDRSTISLEDDGRITSCQWLDAPPKKWAMKENPGYGYYHIRNFGGALKIIKEGHYNLVPGREARRLLAWAYALTDAIKEPILIFHAIDVDNDIWNAYYKKFREYHNWLENI